MLPFLDLRNNFYKQNNAKYSKAPDIPKNIGRFLTADEEFDLINVWPGFLSYPATTQIDYCSHPSGCTQQSMDSPTARPPF